MNGKIGSSQSQSAERASIRYGSSGGDRDRKKLLTALEHLRESAPEVLTAEAQKEVESLYRKFRESRFYLVFLGQFKRGKTSLLNSVLGIDLLPTGVLPLTSIVTIVRYGVRAWARVKFSDGSHREIALTELPAYVTERGNPKNRKSVAEVEVFYPAPRLEDGLCLVDTPGIASIFEHNTQLAYRFVPHADAAIFVFSPESPLSKAELEFLHHLRGHVEKIFFVLNKSDQISDSEQAEILEFAREAIRQQMPSGELRFFPLSARKALAAIQGSESGTLEASGLPQFARALDQFLGSHGEAVLARSTCTALRRIVRNELLAMELEERALRLSTTELEQRIRTIEHSWQSLVVRHREAGYVLRGEIRALESDLERQLNEFAQTEVPRLLTHMQSKLKEYEGTSKHELARTLDQELRRALAEILDEWIPREDQLVQTAFESLTASFTREAAETVEQIQQVAAQQFGFSWTATPLPDRLGTQSEFRIMVDELTTWGLGQFPFLLPKKLFSRYLASRLEQTCLQELYRNAGRLKADLGDRLEQSLTSYLRALDTHVEKARESVLAALNRAAAAKEGSRTSSEEAALRQSHRLKLLQEIDSQLSAISGQVA